MLSSSRKNSHLVLSRSPWSNQGPRGFEIQLQYFSEITVPRIQAFGTQSLRSFPGPLPPWLIPNSNFCPPLSSSLNLSKSPQLSNFSFACFFLNQQINPPGQKWMQIWSCIYELPYFPRSQAHKSSLLLPLLPSHKFCFKFCPAFLLAGKRAQPLCTTLTKNFPTPIFSIFVGLYFVILFCHFTKILEGR